ncbi:MAG: Ig-like domain-containing protein [Gemmatimonadaceae bacterium]
MRRQILGLIGLVVVVSCQDSGPSSVPTLAPSMDPSFFISDGRTGGNSEAFWGTPLAQNPQNGDLNVDPDAHALLRPFLRICETDGAAPPAGCLVDVTLQATGSQTGLVMSYNSGNEFYTTIWQTNNLDKLKNYRLEVWGLELSSAAEKAAADLRWLFTVRDVSHAPNVSACLVTQAFCFIKYGQTIPVKVRLEQFVFCPVTRNCGMQFVSAGTDANLQATLPSSAAASNAQFFIPGQAGTNMAVAFEPCTAAEDAALSIAADIVLVGPCTKTVVKSTVALGTPAVISFCTDLDPSGFGLPHNQLEQLALHHFSNDLTRIQALPEAWQCGTPTSGQVASAETKGVLHFARALRDRVMNLVTPKQLFASASMIDRGGGGEDPFIGTFHKLGLPAKFEYVVATDASQEVKAGDPVLLSAKVVDFEGAPVQGARVHWAVIAPPSDGATVLGSVPAGPTLTGADGIAQTTATTNPFRGFNVFHAKGRGIADDRETGCTVPPSTPSTCNGPRATFDPFFPYHVPEFDASGIELPVELPLGTRLMFTIFGKGQPAH